MKAKEMFEKLYFDYIYDKDKYIEHLMKNIRVVHEYNNFDNIINYRIIFENEYIKKRGK